MMPSLSPHLFRLSALPPRPDSKPRTNGPAGPTGASEQPAPADTVEVAGKPAMDEATHETTAPHEGENSSRPSLWKRVTSYALHSAHLLIEAAEATDVLAGMAVGGAVGAAIVGAGTSVMGVGHIVEGVRDKSCEKVIEGVGGLLIGAKSGLEAVALSGEHSTGSLALLAHQAHQVVAPLGVAHGALEAAMGMHRIYKGAGAHKMREVVSGTLSLGLGAAVCATSLGGGLPAVIASGVFLAGRIAFEESDKNHKVSLLSTTQVLGPKTWRLLD